MRTELWLFSMNDSNKEVDIVVWKAAPPQSSVKGQLRRYDVFCRGRSTEFTREMAAMAPACQVHKRSTWARDHEQGRRGGSDQGEQSLVFGIGW